MTRRILYRPRRAACCFPVWRRRMILRCPAAALPRRYEALWTKSPFSVATARRRLTRPTIPGRRRTHGRHSYVNVVDKQSGEHFIVTSDKPARGLTLVSVSRGQGAGDASAIMKKDTGEAITSSLRNRPSPVAQPRSPLPCSGVVVVLEVGGAPAAGRARARILHQSECGLT